MDTISYKEKYLKYKNKYMVLKSMQEHKKQSGGFMYAPGEYIFFIPNNKKQLVDNELLVKNKSIPSLDKLTNELGNCTRFLRIGSNVNNKTVYTNQSSFDVMKRESKDVKDKTVQAYNVTKEETKKAWEVSKPYIYNTWKSTKPEANVGYNTVRQEYNGINANSQNGGIGENNMSVCDKLPITLSSNLKGFGFDNEVNETNLIDYIKSINEKQGESYDQKIGRVIIVQKKTNTFGFGGETKLKYDFDVSYNDNNVIVTKK